MHPFEQQTLYEKLPHAGDDEQQLDENTYIPQPPSGNYLHHFKSTLVIVGSLGSLLAIVLFGSIILSRLHKPLLSQISISTHIPTDYCGHSPDEARSKGCKFEVNNFAWLHPDCYDQELDEDWTTGPLSKDLKFWEQYGGIGPIPFERVRKGDVPMVWVNTRQHRRHCLFVWEKYQRAAEKQMPMDNYTVNIRHTRHCVGILRNESIGNDEVTSFLSLKYPSCEYGAVSLNIEH